MSGKKKNPGGGLCLQRIALQKPVFVAEPASCHVDLIWVLTHAEKHPSAHKGEFIYTYILEQQSLHATFSPLVLIRIATLLLSRSFARRILSFLLCPNFLLPEKARGGASFSHSGVVVISKSVSRARAMMDSLDEPQRGMLLQ